MKKFYAFILLVLIFSFLIQKNEAQDVMSLQLEELSHLHLKDAIYELRDMLSIPNIGTIPAHVEANVRWMDNAFSARDFDINILETDGPPLLLAGKHVDDSYPTVLFYMHVDGQPVDPSKWSQEDPFTPVLKEMDESGNWEIIEWDRIEGEIDPEWRIFARSASDDKGPIGMFLKAIDILEEEGYSPAYNVKVVLDFEEEIGSPHLPDAVVRYRDELMADHMVILDGPRHPGNLPTISFGARGIQTMTLTVHGPKNPQHSGHYGNYTPNPAFRLAEVLSSMKDEHGRVTIPGFYDGIELDEETLKILKAVPDDEESIKEKMGIAGQDSVAVFLQAARQYPSLNIRGMASGWVGDDVRTIIPSEAIAEIDIRLVVESDPDRLIQLVKDHIRTLGYHITDEEPSDEERLTYDRLITVTHDFSYEAYRTDIDSPTGDWLSRAMNRAFDEEPVLIRTSGGSVPISPFVTTLGVPAVGVPTVNNDNNQHSPDENLRIGNFREGIKTVLSILTEPVE
ncbi:M20/M25/M40 family metallo-hydrolase [soil metagenome]